MSRDRPAERQNAPPGFAAPWYRNVLRTIVRIKLTWLLTGLVTISVFSFSASFILDRLQHSTATTFVAGLCRLIADACLSSALIGFAYEWIVRKEATAVLESTFDASLGRQGASLVDTIIREIPLALLLDKRLQKSVVFTSGKLDEIIRGALDVRLGDQELSGSIYDGFLQKTFSYSERYADLRMEVTLSDVSEVEPKEVRDTFFDVVVNLRFRTRLDRTSFGFARALDHDQFNARIRNPDYLFTWRVEESTGLPRESDTALRLYRFSVDDVRFEGQPQVGPDGAYEILLSNLPIQDKLGQEVTIHYAVQTKLHKHDHVFFYTATRPTKGVTVLFSYARTSIESVLTFDFFVSRDTPVIYTIPPERPHTVVVEIDEWVFPKGGVSFVWRLAGEREGDLETRRVPTARSDVMGDGSHADESARP